MARIYFGSTTSAIRIRITTEEKSGGAGERESGRSVRNFYVEAHSLPAPGYTS
jgi:hypothetical protein